MWWAVEYWVATSLRFTTVFSLDSHLETGPDGRGEDDGPCQHALETCLRQLWPLQAEVGWDNFQTLSSFSFFCCQIWSHYEDGDTDQRLPVSQGESYVDKVSCPATMLHTTIDNPRILLNYWRFSCRLLHRIKYNGIVLRLFFSKISEVVTTWYDAHIIVEGEK